MSGPYARLYLSLVDDEKFAAIYDDDHHFATWCRLLMIAEPAWPASAHLPVTAKPSSIKALQAAGLIDLQPGGRYRIHGLDAERERRHQQAQSASTARWNAARNAASTAGAFKPLMPNRTEPSIEEPNRTDAREDPLVDAFILVRHRTPTERQRAFLVDYLSVFDQTGPERGSRVILAHPDDPIGALKADLEEHRKSRLEVVTAQEAESKERKRAPSGFRPGTPEYELMQHWAKGDDAA